MVALKYEIILIIGDFFLPAMIGIPPLKEEHILTHASGIFDIMMCHDFLQVVLQPTHVDNTCASFLLSSAKSAVFSRFSKCVSPCFTLFRMYVHLLNYSQPGSLRS